MFTNRLVAIAAATLFSSAVFAALTLPNPFQAPSQKVKQHEMVTQGAGEWEGTITMHLPGAPEPVVTACTESVQAIGDYWTVSDFQSNFEGQAFQGSSTMGYDVEKKKFVATWVDSMSTSFTQMEGTYDANKKVIVMDYEAKDPATGEAKDARMTLQHNGDSYTSSFYDVTEDGENLTMVIEMHRKKVVEANSDKSAEKQ
ncbi:MAG TPA: DUF1579 family protein [Planctomycetota bacterium]|nr:DUF1579 family protein [Planctomycetota bacterium]HPF13472.1 DUF1579 family protein [Planctomycetota bacterium]HRV80326.1 DUF1579 family protein [Planctomycetota bacterium]